MLTQVIERRAGSEWRVTIGRTGREYLVRVELGENGEVTLCSRGATLVQAEARAMQDVERWFATQEERTTLVALLRASIALVHRQRGDSPVRLLRGGGGDR